ncbi:MAG: HIRAN domain-containing protein [Brevefilum sp.]
MIREPQNEFDPNAIKIILFDGSKIGYINKKLARKLLQF